jgi:hypothetical protein
MLLAFLILATDTPVFALRQHRASPWQAQTDIDNPSLLLTAYCLLFCLLDSDFLILDSFHRKVAKYAEI